METLTFWPKILKCIVNEDINTLLNKIALQLAENLIPKAVKKWLFYYFTYRPYVFTIFHTSKPQPFKVQLGLN